MWRRGDGRGSGVRKAESVGCWGSPGSAPKGPPSGCLHPRSGDRRGLVSTYALAGEGVEKLGPDTLRVGM